MKSVLLFIVLAFITCRFGWAVISGLKAGRFYSYYGPNLEPDIKEEPIGFAILAIVYLAILGGFLYLTVEQAIAIYSQYFS